MPASLPPSMSVPLALFSSSAVDEEFETVSTQLLKRTQAMLNKYRLLLLEESRVGGRHLLPLGTLPPSEASEGRREAGGQMTGAVCIGPHPPRVHPVALSSPSCCFTCPPSPPPEGEPLRRDGHDRPNVHSGGEDHPCLGQTASQGEAW